MKQAIINDARVDNTYEHGDWSLMVDDPELEEKRKVYIAFFKVKKKKLTSTFLGYYLVTIWSVVPTPGYILESPAGIWKTYARAYSKLTESLLGTAHWQPGCRTAVGPDVFLVATSDSDSCRVCKLQNDNWKWFSWSGLMLTLEWLNPCKCWKFCPHTISRIT